MSLPVAVWQRMKDDDTLVADLGSYNGAPAIVVADDGTFPEDIPTPFVAVMGVDTDEADDTKTTVGRDQEVRIQAYSNATGSTLVVNRIAERIRTLFHRQPVGLADGAYLATCSGPTVAPTDATLYGRDITVRVVSAA